MRIGEIDIPPVQPTKTGLYLARKKDGKATCLAMPTGNMLRLGSGELDKPENWDCFGPLMFSGQADKLHTTYKIDPQWHDPNQAGTPGRS